jgi:hypothetical protein
MQLFSTNPHRPGIFAIGQEAVGVIAIGQAALGVVAIGQIARGVFCLGQGAIGVFCVGQGSVGLVSATGMLGIGGTSGYGIVLHLLPRRVAEPLPNLPPTIAIDSLVRREVSDGWIAAPIVRGTDGEPTVVLDGKLRIETSAIRERLASALQRGEDRAHLRVRADLVVDDSAYRSAETHMALIADDAITYTSKRPHHWSYGVPPKGAVGGRASPVAIAWRSTLWLAVLAFVTAVTFQPLATALLELMM